MPSAPARPCNLSSRQFVHSGPQPTLWTLLVACPCSPPTRSFVLCVSHSRIDLGGLTWVGIFFRVGQGARHRAPSPVRRHGITADGKSSSCCHQSSHPQRDQPPRTPGQRALVNQSGIATPRRPNTTPSARIPGNESTFPGFLPFNDVTMSGGRQPTWFFLSKSPRFRVTPQCPPTGDSAGLLFLVAVSILDA